MQRRHSNATPDCEEKRDPDERQRPDKQKGNELDQTAQLEKQPLAVVPPLVVWHRLFPLVGSSPCSHLLIEALSSEPNQYLKLAL